MTTNQNNPLVGTWKLESFQVQRKNGQIHHPFGKNPIGQFIYMENGRFSTQMSQPGRIPVKSGDIMDASHEEMGSNFRGFISYFGYYDYDAKKKEVLHHVEASLFPNWDGDVLKRKVKIRGKRLELITEPTLYGNEKITGVVVWKKID